MVSRPGVVGAKTSRSHARALARPRQRVLNDQELGPTAPCPAQAQSDLSASALREIWVKCFCLVMQNKSNSQSRLGICGVHSMWRKKLLGPQPVCYLVNP